MGTRAASSARTVRSLLDRGRRVSESEPAPQPAPSGAIAVDHEPEGDLLRTAMRLALLSVLAFLPVIACSWVFWDDSKNFLANTDFRGLTWSHLAWAWRATVLGVYQPLGWIVLEAEYSAWGLNPHGYHIVSLAFHAANVVALLLLTVTLLRRCLPDLYATQPATIHRAAGLAVAFFAIHPLRAEPVGWVSAQTYLPSALFAVLCVLAYLRAFESGRPAASARRWFLVALGMYVVALLFKVVAISVPAVLLILDVYPLGRLGQGTGLAAWFGPKPRRVWLEKLPFVLVGYVFAAVAISVRPVHAMSLGSRLASASCAVCFYLAKTIVPTDLRVIYTPCSEATFRQPLYVACALVAVAITVATWLLRRRWPALLAAWAAYLVIVAPNSGIVPVTPSVAADRYSYVATMGFTVVLAGLFTRWAIGLRLWRRAARWAVRLSAAALIVVLVVASWYQSATWMSAVVLWSHAIAHGGETSVVAQHNLGNAYSELGLLNDALTHFEKAEQLRPDQFLPHVNVGVTLTRLGRFDEAVPHLAAAVALDPTSGTARTHLGVALSRLGKTREAEAMLREVVRLDPTDAEARNNLGLVLLEQQRTSEATACFIEAIRLRPGFDEARENLARARGDAPTPPAR